MNTKPPKPLGLPKRPRQDASRPLVAASADAAKGALKVKPKPLHRHNVHRQGYPFAALAKTYPPLSQYLTQTVAGTVSIDYADPGAVMALNAALLQHDYAVMQWRIPAGFLCPPVPGRVDYVHYVAELLGLKPGNKKPWALLDVGTGANGIYALLAAKVYSARCVACDIDPAALANVAAILASNPDLKSAITVRQQLKPSNMFSGIILPGEYYDVTVCNPPFHSSLEEALKGSQKKSKALAGHRGKAAQAKTSLNFGGQKAELWCKGGEKKFIRMMIKESLLFASQCGWFTTLVSKAENIAPAKKLLRKQAATVKEIPMLQGNKITRILAWRYE